MARPRGSSKAPRPRHRRRENLPSLSTEVLRLRLQALNLPITGGKAELISRLKAAVEQPRPTKQPPPGRVRKATSKKSSRSDRDPVTARANGVDEVSDNSSSAGSVDDLAEDDENLSQFGLSVPQSVTPVQKSGAFSEAQMAAIQDTVRLSVEQALNSRSYLPVEPFLGTSTPNTETPTPHRQGTGSPLGLHRPLDRNLEDKILRGTCPHSPSKLCQSESQRYFRTWKSLALNALNSLLIIHFWQNKMSILRTFKKVPFEETTKERESMPKPFVI